MTIVVSISQFRKHVSDYIAKAENGDTVIVKDEKKDQQVAQLLGKKTFNPEAFGRALEQARGIFAAENHPEWQTKQDVTKWLEKERKSADRVF